MKHIAFVAVCAMTLVLSGAARAQTDGGAPPQSAPSATDFATVKAQLIARLQQELACVQAATTAEALQACRPHPPGGHSGPPPHQ